MPLLGSYRCLCSWLVPHAQGMFICVGTGGRLSLYRGSGARMSHVSGIGEERLGSVPFVSHRPGFWPPAPGCLCAVEDGPVGDI